MKKQGFVKSVVRYIILIILSIIMFFPFYWMIITAFKTFGEAMLFPPTMVPESLYTSNFITVLYEADIMRYMINSLIVTVSQLIACLIITILGAFALARLNIKGKNLILAFMLSLTMIPFELIVLTNFRTIINIGLHDNLLALIIPFVANVFYVIILRNNFLASSSALYYSAKIDGASDSRYLWKILVPLSKPTLISIALFNVIASWNSFMWPFLVINSPRNRTWPFGLFAFATEQWTNVPLTMAASTITILPVFVFFTLMRKHLVKSVYQGGIKS